MFCQEIFCPGILFPGKFWIRENSKLGTYDSKLQEKRTIKSDLVIGTLNEEGQRNALLRLEQVCGHFWKSKERKCWRPHLLSLKQLLKSWKMRKLTSSASSWTVWKTSLKRIERPLRRFNLPIDICPKYFAQFYFAHLDICSNEICSKWRRHLPMKTLAQFHFIWEHFWNGTYYTKR